MAKPHLKHVLITGAMLIAPILVFAEENANVRVERQNIKQEAQQKRQTQMLEAKTKRETFKKEAEQRINALKKRVGEERAKRIEQFFNQMVRKFENAIDRLNGLADRIESRLQKSEEAGHDVSKIKDQLKSARDKISAAETALSDAKAKFKEMTNSQNPKESFRQVKTLVQGVAQKIKEAHRALVGVVNSIKGLRLGNEATSTSSR
ncbi:hypothetical protein A2661_00230 [Candidatus Giovannonibacteria bacterium RIFCSPHIGHO2_01_FULL_45_24]|uniref:DUF5667 domain-containing protein n=1 Tax=Candidatus Giovannonibacteria bacterium RIFCSPLOWO2_01_FULL_46_32 TaxID=1798353 RepID=A0A1F5XGR7_9BACT|nr:MAG: hypothetical protein A2661_00230 [Candidatus Giovannonibacteria bacterium RIFCSPHIGHO2_01_FULL_45_24]OGF87006.1 MAG: hypothetical protein A3B19_01070 [Candidatus Giovannonibacteria bacterium RIFCSPLOWO2_01_FULL_46_32]